MHDGTLGLLDSHNKDHMKRKRVVAMFGGVGTPFDTWAQQAGQKKRRIFKQRLRENTMAHAHQGTSTHQATAVKPLDID